MFLEKVPLELEDPVLGLARKFKESKNPNKVNLGIGIVRDEFGHSPVFDAVARAEKEIISKSLGKEYLPIGGDPDFLEAVSTLLFGEISKMEGYCAFQTLGGTGALWIALSLAKKGGASPLVVFEPTWPNHLAIGRAEGMPFLMLPYNEGNFSSLENVPEGSLVLLQTACHNPLGKDPSLEQWEALFDQMRKKNLCPLFDNAYQGFGIGFFEDTAPMRSWFSKGGEGFIATSFSKNMGLYGERAGMLSVIVSDKRRMEAISSFARVRIRTALSNPPLHPSRIVVEVINNQQMSASWQKELTEIRARLTKARSIFQESINERLGRKIDLSGRGLFTRVPLSADAIERLYLQDGIVMMENGRINISGITAKNRGYVVEALCRELKNDR